jgi:hypothetical protein
MPAHAVLCTLEEVRDAPATCGRKAHVRAATIAPILGAPTDRR